MAIVNTDGHIYILLVFFKADIYLIKSFKDMNLEYRNSNFLA